MFLSWRIFINRRRPTMRSNVIELVLGKLQELPLGLLLDVSPGDDRRCGRGQDRATAVRGRRNKMGAPEWTSVALLLRGTNKDSSFLSSASSTACVCSTHRRARRAAVGRRGEARRERLPRRHA